MKKQPPLLIHFTNPNVCFDELSRLRVALNPELKSYLLTMHDSVRITTKYLPENLMAEVCFRCANQMIKRVEMDTKIRFERYKKSDYALR